MGESTVHSCKQILPRKNNKFAINILQHHDKMYLTLYEKFSLLKEEE
jgi:hypothetical protein